MSDPQTPTPAVPFETALAKYSDDDARSIGMPTPGALNMLSVFAKQMTGTPFLPRSIFKEMSVPQASATLLAVILTGREMSFTPMQSLRAFWMSPDGRLGMYGDSMMAAMRKAGFIFDWHQNNDDGCSVTAKRPIRNGSEWESYTSTYTVEMAKAAGLWTKEKSIWPKYPARMCKWRCVGDLFRTLGSDLGGGQMYAKEELDDVIDLQPDSTTGEPTAADELRSDQLANKYHVGLKPKPDAPEPAPEAAAPVQSEEPKPGPAQTVQSDSPAPVASAEPPKPDPTPARHLKYFLFRQDDKGKPVPMYSESALPTQDAAQQRATTLANELARVVYAATMDDNGTPTILFTANPPAVQSAQPVPAQPVSAEPPKPAPKPEPVPASAPETAKTEAAQTQTDAGTSNLRKRLQEITNAVERAVNNGVAEEHKQPIKTVGARVKSFLVAYFDVKGPKDLPQEEARYVDAFPDLEAVADRDVNELFSDPAGTARRLAADNANWQKAFEYFKWPPELCQLARAYGRKRGLNADDSRAFFTNLELDFVSVTDAEAALRLAIGSRRAGKFVRTCTGHKASVAAAVYQMETKFLHKKLEECKEPDVDSAIDWASKAMENAAAPAPKATAEPEPAKPAADDGDDLFGDLG